MDNRLRFLTNKIFLLFAVIAFLISGSFFYQLSPVSSSAPARIFEIRPGEGFFEISARLKSGNFIRSIAAFEIYSVIIGSARKMKPGIYELSAGSSAPRIAGILSGPANETEVTILDGASVYDIDALLGAKKILPAGFLISFAQNNDIEGKLYPDTYKFFEHSDVKTVVDKFLENFRAKAEPILNNAPVHYKSNLILASLVQKEVSDPTDSRIVAGILKKRLSAGMKLDVDATICYLKKILKGQSACYPLESSDFKIDSPYNTYLGAGLPPGPIGSPNESALKAVLNPISSPYWFYLSDPKTGKTIFSETLDEQSANRGIYLK